MMEMVERVARAIAQADEQNGGPPYDYRITLSKHAKEQLFDQARAAIEATNYATLETALRTIQSAVLKYLKKEMTAEEFALVVIGECDNGKINEALEVRK